jgi:hypothetical protein
MSRNQRQITQYLAITSVRGFSADNSDRELEHKAHVEAHVLPAKKD